MKKILLSIVFMLIIALSAFAQNNIGFKYQAVVRDATNQAIANGAVSLRFSIVRASTSTILYSETHHATTTDMGVVNVTIGKGTVSIGAFANINWANDQFALRVELDPGGGNNFKMMGESPLLAVPYALHAETVTNKDDADANPTNELQTLTFNSSTNELSISNGNSIIIPTGGTDADADPTNEIQTITKNGNIITLSNNGGSFTDEVNDADADPTNEIQTITKNGSQISLSQNGGTVSIEDADANPTNEIQTITKNGSQISLSQNGGTVSIEDADADPTNEIQTITKNGNTITLSNNGGSFIDEVNDADADPTNEIQTITKNGNTITLSNNGGSFIDEVNDADADPTNELQMLSLNGNQIEISNGNTLDLSPILPSGGTDDQTLSLNGNSLSIADGNAVDLSSFQTPWQPSLSGIEYTSGIARVRDVNTDIETAIRPGQIIMNNSTNDLVYFNSDLLKFQNENDPNKIVTDISRKGIDIFEAGFPIVTRTLLNKDSLFFHYPSTGLLLPSFGTMNAFGLKFDNITAKGALSAYGLNLSNDFSKLELGTNYLSMRETQGAIIFDRISLQPDSLTLWNDTKWKNAWLGTNPIKKNGGLKLYNGGNDQPIAILGDADIDNFFGNAPEGGLHLFDSDGIERVSLSSIFKSGSLFIQNDSTYLNTEGGIIEAGSFPPTPPGVFSIIEPRFQAGVQNQNGFLNIFSNDSFFPNPVLDAKAGMRVDLGLGSVFSDGFFKIKYPNENKYSTSVGHFGAYLYDSLGVEAAAMWRDHAYEHLGYFTAFGDTHFPVFHAGANWAGNNISGGMAAVYDGEHQVKAGLEVDDINVGRLFTVNGLTETRDETGHVWSFFDKNQFTLPRIDDVTFPYVASISRVPTPGAQNTGQFTLWGENQSPNVYAGYNFFSSSPDNINKGYAAVLDNNFAHKAGMFVSDSNQGILFADVKNFRMDHPTEKSKEIWYASLEGPEAAAYVRGTAQLIDGEAFVPFPAHFQLVANPSSMTVILTPMSADTYGLAVIEKTATGIRVKDLKNGKGNFEFDWEVKCVRKGYEDYKVIREKVDTPK